MEIGSCRLIMGPMFSQKSTTLMTELTTLADIGMKVLYINHDDDVRETEASDNTVTTHHSQFKGLSKKIVSVRAIGLADVDIDGFDVIGVDEGQFFDDLDVAVRRWVLMMNRHVVIASLDGDYLMRPFGKAHNLICICSPGNVVKLGAFCVDCMAEVVPYRHLKRVPAGYTARLKAPSDTNVQKEVGGKDKYIPVCMRCFKQRLDK